MTSTFKHYKPGNIFGIYYTFNKGQGLRMHLHSDDMFHNVIVLKGKVAVYGYEGLGLKVVESGTVFDFDSSQPHEVCALTDNTIILNLYISGTPDEYANMPIEQQSGSMDIELTHKIDDYEFPIPVMVG